MVLASWRRFGVLSFTSPSSTQSFSLFQAFKTQRSATGSAQGGRWSGGGAARVMPQPLRPLGVWGGMQSPLKLPGGPVFTSAGFGISLSLWEPLWIRSANHQFGALKILGGRAFIFPPKNLPAPINDLTEHKTPREISFRIPAFNSYVHLELFSFTLCFFLSPWHHVFKLPHRTASGSPGTSTPLPRGSRSGLVRKTNHH